MSEDMKVFSQKNPPRLAVSRHFSGSSVTEQHHAAQVDINSIIKSYVKTGELPMTRKTPTFGDFSSVEDFQSSVDMVQRSFADFYSLDAELRARFSNQPAQLLSFLSDPQNREEAISLGLIDSPIEPQSGPVDNSDSSTQSN